MCSLSPLRLFTWFSQDAYLMISLLQFDSMSFFFQNCGCNLCSNVQMLMIKMKYHCSNPYSFCTSLYHERTSVSSVVDTDTEINNIVSAFLLLFSFFFFKTLYLNSYPFLYVLFIFAVLMVCLKNKYSQPLCL